jgi:hypothetical protein
MLAIGIRTSRDEKNPELQPLVRYASRFIGLGGRIILEPESDAVVPRSVARIFQHTAGKTSGEGRSER